MHVTPLYTIASNFLYTATSTQRYMGWNAAEQATRTLTAVSRKSTGLAHTAVSMGEGEGRERGEGRRRGREGRWEGRGGEGGFY